MGAGVPYPFAGAALYVLYLDISVDNFDIQAAYAPTEQTCSVPVGSTTEIGSVGTLQDQIIRRLLKLPRLLRHIREFYATPRPPISAALRILSLARTRCSQGPP